MPAWIPYTALRLGLFGATFALLMLLQVHYVVAAAAGAVVGLTISYIFFPTLRDRVSEELAASRERRSAAADADDAQRIAERGVDEQAEDGDATPESSSR